MTDYYMTQDAAVAAAGNDPGRAVWTPKGWMAVGADTSDMGSPAWRGLQLPDDDISLYEYLTKAEAAEASDGIMAKDLTNGVQTFFDACANGPAGLIPRGRYKITRQIDLDPAAGYNVRGVRYSPNSEAKYASVIYQLGAGADGISVVDDPYSGVADRSIRISDINIVGNSTTRHGFHAAFTSVFLERVWISNFGEYGARLDSIWSSTFKQCVMAHNRQYGAFMAADGNAVTFEHCVFNANSYQDGFAGLGITGPEYHENVGVKIVNCDFTSNGQHPGVTQGYGLVIQRSRGVSVDACYFESNKWRNLYADSTAKGLVVNSNYFQDADNELTAVEGLAYFCNDHRNAFLDRPLVVRISGGFPASVAPLFYFGNIYRNSATVGFSNGAGVKNEFFYPSQPPDGVGSRNDICWNTNVGAAGAVGWVCFMDGATPRWRAF